MNLSGKTNESKLLIAFLSAMGVIFILILFLAFRKPGPGPTSNNTQQIRDSITMLTTQIEEEKKITDHYLHVVDSLKSLPPIIIYKYREQKKFTSTATINQLDSLIRANSGLKPRIKRY